MEDMQEILSQITQLESEIAIKKNAVEKMQNDINFTKMESQKELAEVNRLQQCNESMRTKQETEKAIIQEQNNREEFNSFLDMLSDNIGR